jgi:hypothetical protein
LGLGSVKDNDIARATKSLWRLLYKQCSRSGSVRIWIILITWIRINSKSGFGSKWWAGSGTGSASICRWQAKLYGIWAYLRKYNKLVLGSGMYSDKAEFVKTPWQEHTGMLQKKTSR